MLTSSQMFYSLIVPNYYYIKRAFAFDVPTYLECRMNISWLIALHKYLMSQITPAIIY